ncbi:MAG: DUF1554 domain-containing protein [bacterium]|nr:DUF1554 domain-containing protein [bacterium]
MELANHLNQVWKTFGLTGAIIAALLTVSCTTDDDDDSATLLAGSALVLVQNATSSSSSSSTGCAGSGHCLMFVTNAAVTVTTGIAGLDSQCQSNASKPSGGGTYKALIVDGTNRIACTTANCGGGTAEHTDWVLKPNKEYRRADGTTVIGTTSANGVFAFPLTNSVDPGSVPTNAMRTGMNNDWTSNANDCTNWSTTGGVAAGGVNNVTSNALIFIGTSGCTNSDRAVCVEQ